MHKDTQNYPLSKLQLVVETILDTQLSFMNQPIKIQ